MSRLKLMTSAALAELMIVLMRNKAMKERMTALGMVGTR